MDSELIAHITSHDLHDPLVQARIYSNELLQQNNPANNEKLILISNLIDEMLKKIAILRDFAYISNNKGKYEELDLDIITHEILEEFSEKIKSANADITISKLPVVHGNKRHLKRLLSYLIDNSLTFSDTNKKLKIVIEAKEEEKFWHFTIADNGIGMDEIYQELVFILFQKLKTQSANNYGEGLAFAKKIVENHGGEIWYKSDGKSGTIFHFTIKKAV